LRKLEKISPMDMSADKVRVICEHTYEKGKAAGSYDDYYSGSVVKTKK
jgi:hypothetical protein